MNKQAKLDKIAKEIENCKTCKMGKSGKAVVGEGNPNAEIVFIGEAPGKNEALIGRPFIGRSGKLLRSMITSIGLKEEDVYITSSVKYLPDAGTPSSNDITHGRVHLLDQLQIISPKLVVLLGRVAAEGVLQNPPSPKGFGRARKVFVMKEHGQIVQESDGVKYYLTIHPAAAIRFVKFKKVFEEDFRKLKSLF